MSFIYALLLAAVGGLVVAEIVATVRRVSLPPDARRRAASMHPVLVPIEAEDRRRQSLSYVGHDRRATSAHDIDQAVRRRA
jgi:hypothetical protein